MMVPVSDLDRRGDATPRGFWVRLSHSPMLYPVLFALYPIVFLWAQNLTDDVDLSSLVPVLGGVMGGTFAVWLLLRVALRDPARAGFASAVVVIAFLSFGHVLNHADPYGGRGVVRPIFVAYLVIVAAGLVVAARASWVGRVAPVANLVGAALIAMNLIPIVLDAIDPQRVSASPIAVEGLDPGGPGHGRDVYYLIFDRYGREDVLREQLGFDNEPFLSALRERGFMIPAQSVANYPRTTHSLAASLNMSYLDDIAAEAGAGNDDWRPLRQMLRGSVVQETFRQLGYMTVQIGSWWEPTSKDPAADRNEVFDPIDEFGYVFSRTTMWPTISRFTGIGDPTDRSVEAWQRTKEQLEAIERTAEEPATTFTFAHVLLPHPPYVFDADGSYAAPGTHVTVDDAYLGQLRYANERILEIVDTLLAGPDETDPIIVLQSDEGPNPDALTLDQNSYDFTSAPQADLERKLGILNAYYLPGAAATPHTTITPVNTFRMIFGAYFDAHLPLLPDRVFVYRDEAHPYELHDVTDRLIGRG
jgi:hypothetical protein